jgi:hypothetical protein
MFASHAPDDTDRHLPAESRELVVTATGQCMAPARRTWDLAAGYEVAGFDLARKTATLLQRRSARSPSILSARTQ